jgi:hypothetical protein
MICPVVQSVFVFYIDPGSGALLLQIVGAFFVGALFHFRSFLSRLAGRARSLSHKLTHQP